METVHPVVLLNLLLDSALWVCRTFVVVLEVNVCNNVLQVLYDFWMVTICISSESGAFLAGSAVMQSMALTRRL